MNPWPAEPLESRREEGLRREVLSGNRLFIAQPAGVPAAQVAQSLR
jgi:hypothetical protein